MRSERRCIQGQIAHDMVCVRCVFHHFSFFYHLVIFFVYWFIIFHHFSSFSSFFIIFHHFSSFV